MATLEMLNELRTNDQARRKAKQEKKDRTTVRRLALEHFRGILRRATNDAQGRFGRVTTAWQVAQSMSIDRARFVAEVELAGMVAADAYDVIGY